MGNTAHVLPLGLRYTMGRQGDCKHDMPEHPPVFVRSNLWQWAFRTPGGGYHTEVSACRTTLLISHPDRAAGLNK